MPELKKNWTLSPQAFQRLLEWFDDGRDSKGERYLEVRRRLTAYFDRKNCTSSDELTDETLNRVARKLEEKGAITDVSVLHYCYIVAKFVFLENIRRPRIVQGDAPELVRSDLVAGESPPDPLGLPLTGREERMYDCLEQCLGKLAPEDRALILDYYRGEQRAKIERRSALAARAGISANALTIRACRIRNKLEGCVRKCSAEG